MSDEFNNDFTTEPINLTEVPVEEKKGLSIASFVLGLVGIVAWCLPLLGYPITIAGIITGALGIKKGGKVFAIIGIICSAVFLIATIVNSVLGAMMAVNDMMGCIC